MITASDALNSCIRYLGGQSEDQAAYDCKEAIVDALNGLWGEADWAYYTGQIPIQLDPPYNTGLVTYTAATRQFTLSGGTWPTWALYGALRVGGDEARVSKRISNTVIQIEPNTAFETDITSPVAYGFFHNEYPIDGNVRKVANMYIEKNSVFPLMYVPAIEFKVRRPGVNSALPRLYTVMRDRFVEGGLIVAFWPYPGTNYSARFNVIKKPATPITWSETVGKVSVTAAGTTVTGTSTEFDAFHPGCVIRIGSNATDIPGAFESKNPRSDETIIDSVTDPTHLEGTTAFTTSRTNVKYEISSLLDIDSLMREAFTQRCYLSLAARRSFDPIKTNIIRSGYQQALSMAISASMISKDVKYSGDFTGRYTSSYFAVLV